MLVIEIYYVCANKVDFVYANPRKNIAHHGEWLYDVTCKMDKISRQL